MRGFYSLFLLLLYNFQGATAQLYSKLTVPSGVQAIRNNVITITPSGSASGGNNLWSGCNSDPYNIALNHNGISGSYQFDFSVPVSRIRLPMTATNIGELNSIFINGTKYIITSRNIDSLKTCDTQYYHQNEASANGDVIYTGPIVASEPWFGRFGSCVVNIEIPTGINSVRVLNNGQGGGTVMGFYFMGIPLLLDNNSNFICMGDTLRLTAEPEIPNATYSWTGPSGFRSSQRTPLILKTTPENEGAYICTVTTLSDTAVDTTYVKFKPIPVVDPMPDIEVCLGDTVTLSASADIPGAVFKWRPPREQQLESTANPLIENIQEANAGIYSVTATVDGCESTPVQFQLKVNKPAFGPTSTVFICQGDEYNYKGKIIGEAGIYADTLKGQSSKGCDSIIFLNLQFDPLPNTKIVNISEKPVCLGDSLTLEARGAVSYLWHRNGEYIGTGNSITVTQPELSNQVVLTGFNQYECKYSDTVLINTVGCCIVFVPNAFSPNNDGRNDFFGAKSEGHLQNFRLNVYNRWGQLVFTGYNIESRWNGQTNNMPADAGVYYYNVNGECLNGDKINQNGDFLLIR